MIVPEYTFRPMTRSAMVIERLAAENGRTVASLVRHIGRCDFRNHMLRGCRSAMFMEWDVLDGETGQWRVADQAFKDKKWMSFSAALMADTGEHAACPHCEACHPVHDDEPGDLIVPDRDP